MAINTKKYIESYLKIVDKNFQLIDFKLNKSQLRLYNIVKKQTEANKPVRIIILKARQMGFSTLIEGILFKIAATTPYVKAGIIAHNVETTNAIFNMTKRFYNYLPDQLKPQTKASNAKELIFNTKDGNGLDSIIQVMTAGGENAGVGQTFKFLHCSEIALWPNLEAIYPYLMQGVPNLPGTMVFLESTARGYNKFKELWDDAVAGKNDFIPVFFPWYEDETYKMYYDGFELSPKEKELKAKYNLTNEQLAWRRYKIRTEFLGDEELFTQEYPACPEEAFISTGKCYFKQENIVERLKNLPSPVKRGYFTYKESAYKDDEEQLYDIEWVDDSRGDITIYEDVKQGYPYVLAGDTAGEGSDIFTGHVVDNISGKQIAVLNQEYNETEYAKQMYCLGKYYNWAMIGVETNFSTFPQRELERLKYPKFYERERIDVYTGAVAQSFGFRTDTKTRPLILGQLQSIVLNHPELINDRTTLNEMLTFVKNEKGRPEAEKGKHDDNVMGLAIAHHLRSSGQQRMTVEEIKVENKYKRPKWAQKLIDSRENTGEAFIRW